MNIDFQYDFSTGVPLNGGELQEHREKCLRTLLDDKKQKSSYIRTGSGLTVAFRTHLGEIIIFQTNKGYKEYTVNTHIK